MVILRPPLEQQVSTVPWLLIRNNVDVPSLIGKALTARPNATVDDVVKQLSAWGAQASGIIVSMSMLKWKEQAAASFITQICARTARSWLLTDASALRAA